MRIYVPTSAEAKKLPECLSSCLLPGSTEERLFCWVLYETKKCDTKETPLGLASRKREKGESFGANVPVSSWCSHLFHKHGQCALWWCNMCYVARTSVRDLLSLRVSRHLSRHLMSSSRKGYVIRSQVTQTGSCRWGFLWLAERNWWLVTWFLNANIKHHVTGARSRRD